MCHSFCAMQCISKKTLTLILGKFIVVFVFYISYKTQMLVNEPTILMHASNVHSRSSNFVNGIIEAANSDQRHTTQTSKMISSDRIVRNKNRHSYGTACSDVASGINYEDKNLWQILVLVG